jgi:CRISPR-associated protein Cmx8
MRVYHGNVKEDTIGYVMVVPDVSDLEDFVESFAATVAGLEGTQAGFRPREAILSLPEEGGLQYLNHLAGLAQARARAGEMRFSVTGVEVYCLAKKGNNINLLATARVPARREVLEQYDVIRRQYRNLLFRAQLIRNLLQDRPWYAGFDRLFAVHDRELFVGEHAMDFAVGAAAKFRSESGVSSGGNAA